MFNYFEPDYQQPGDIADAGLYSPEFQILDESTFINGIDMPVDGGLSVLAPSALVSPKVRRWYGREPWPETPPPARRD